MSSRWLSVGVSLFSAFFTAAGGGRQRRPEVQHRGARRRDLRLYEGPSWTKRIVTGPDRTPGVISGATSDLDGKAEVAIAYDLEMNEPSSGVWGATGHLQPVRDSRRGGHGLKMARGTQGRRATVQEGPGSPGAAVLDRCGRESVLIFEIRT